MRQGVVAVIRRGERWLVIERSLTVSAPGSWCFPGGGIEPGEGEEQALIRELQEELAVAVVPRRKLWQSATPGGVQLAWWQADLGGDAIPVPNPAEVQTACWLTLAEMLLKDKLLDSNRRFLAAVQAGEVRWE